MAVRGSILYFVIADLAGIDPMYQFSLAYVKRLFNSAIEKSEPAPSQEERLKVLINNISKNIYTTVSRGLFEMHKLIYSFLITTSIMRNSDSIKMAHWNLLLRGAGPMEPAALERRPQNPDLRIITDLNWDLLFNAEVMDPEIFPNLCKSIVDNWDSWHDWATLSEPHLSSYPG